MLTHRSFAVISHQINMEREDHLLPSILWYALSESLFTVLFDLSGFESKISPGGHLCSNERCRGPRGLRLALTFQLFRAIADSEIFNRPACSSRKLVCTREAAERALEIVETSTLNNVFPILPLYLE